MKPEIYRGDRFQHYKGDTYQIIEPDVLEESTKEPKIVYGSESTGEVWVRPLKEFQEQVEFNGEQVPRFKKCEFNCQWKELEAKREREINTWILNNTPRF